MIHPSANNAILTFGKFKGHSIAHVYYNNQSYLQWMITTVGLPEVWKEAAKLTLNGEDISHLQIAKTNNPTLSHSQKISTDTGVSIHLKDSKTAVVVMPYNPTLMAKFKYEVDGRKWNGEEKCWEFPAVHLPKAFKVFGETNIKCDDKVLNMLSKLKDRREDLDEIRIQEDDKDFKIKGMLLDLYGYQKTGVKFVDRADGRCLIADAPGLGKAQPLDSRILTPTGWKLMGNVSVGDAVLTPNGDTAYIQSIHPQGVKDIYKIWFTDKTYVEACLDHLWKVKTRYQTRWKIITTKQLMETINTSNTRWEIPQISPIEFGQLKSNIIHPYLMGVLLGDGGLTQQRVLLTSKDTELITQINAVLPDNIEIHAQKHSKDIGYVIVRTDGGNTPNIIKEELTRMGLMGKYSYEKEIPEEYMISSLENRISLFQGLMDTDGWCSHTGSTLQYGSTSKKLTLQVKELVESFGGVARLSQKIPKIKNTLHRTFYIVTIALPPSIVPFKLSRKNARYAPRKKYFPKRIIKKIEFSRKSEAQCISLDDNGPLYITDNYTVTHNTAQAIGYAQQKNLKTIIVCPLSVVVNWQREIKKFTGKDATIWDSKSYTGKLLNQFHICHYDAVAKVVADLRKQNFDLLVCDEATYLKNRQTIRAKSILGSYKERRKYPGIKTKYCIFLTGTPVMSRPIEAFALLNFLDKERFNNFFHFTQRYGGWKGDAPRNLQDLHDRTKDLVIRRKKEQILTELPAKQRNDLYVELTKDEQKQYKEMLREVFGKWKVEKPTIGHMPKIQEFLIQKKMPRLVEMVDEFLDNDKPILIFSNYLAPLKFLQEHYGDKSALLTGEMNSKDRQKSIDRLTKGEAKVGLFSLMAAGMGIDGLQKQIDTVVFLNMDWTPANHEQAEDRTHRIGQTSQVQVYYMVCVDTIDEYMRDILKEKQQIADLVVDGALVTPERSKSYFKEFVSKISQVYKEDISTKEIEE